MTCLIVLPHIQAQFMTSLIHTQDGSSHDRVLLWVTFERHLKKKGFNFVVVAIKNGTQNRV